MIVRARPMLGTLVEVRVVDAGDGFTSAVAIDAAFAAIAEVQRLMSAHDPDSDVGRLNAAPTGARLRVHPLTMAVLRLAGELHARSGGLFDCATGAALMRHGFLPPVADLTGRLTARYDDLRLHADGSVELSRPMAIDLGGIAKGFAVDQAIAAMRRCGTAAGLVNAGGDMRAFGPHDWPVAVRHPDAPAQTMALPPLRNAALATSAGYFATRTGEAGAETPIVDPRVGRPLPTLDSITVIATECVVADALTKVCALDVTMGEALLAHYGATAIVVRRRAAA